MNIVLLGPQGSGKGTQGKRLAKQFNIPHISTGDLLRDLASKDTPLAQKVKEILRQGELVSDELLMEVLKDRLEGADADAGFVLDGTPRNLQQAKLLEEVADIDVALLINISDDEAVKRISARWSCPKDKTPYNTITSPPEEEGICDVCGTQLVQRDDDNPESVRKRLDIYHERTKPVAGYFEEKGVLVRIDGEQPIEDVWNDIQEELGEPA